MNVNGLASAAAHPVPPAPSAEAEPPRDVARDAQRAATGQSSSSHAPHPGTAPHPGEATGPHENKAAKAEEKPPPLPPLRGLTVAEIRAMLGVQPPLGKNGQPAASATDPAEASGHTSLVQAMNQRYI